MLQIVRTELIYYKFLKKIINIFLSSKKENAV